MFKTKDSWQRQSFDTWSLRDTNEWKPRYDLISIPALKRIALLMERWAKKYWSWEMLWWVCPKRWYYDVWMTASFWVNWGISAARVTLTSDIPWKEVLLNVWFSNSNDRALAMDQFADNDSDEDLIVYNWQWTRDLVLIEEWQVIYWLFWRMATEISGNWQTTTAPFPNGVMTIFSTPFWFNPWGMGNAVGNPWQWTFWWVAWHCDENWDARYFKE